MKSRRGTGRDQSYRATPKRLIGFAELLVDLAQLLFQFGNQTVYALFRDRISRRLPCKRPVFHDLHFEFHSLGF